MALALTNGGSYTFKQRSENYSSPAQGLIWHRTLFATVKNKTYMTSGIKFPGFFGIYFHKYMGISDRLSRLLFVQEKYAASGEDHLQ